MSILLKNINKRFGNIQAVRNLNLQIDKGNLLSIVGPSGCGKTTTLRMIAGFENPDSGQIYINDQLTNNIAPRNRNIGIVFQNYALFPNLTVFENIAFGLRAKKLAPEVVTLMVNKLLDIIGLTDLEHHLPTQISGGQQQRVALARALAIEPRVLLLDEPLSALDAKVRMDLRYEIKKIQRELNITTIYVTHDQEEALSISDVVAVMNQGEITQFGRPVEIYNEPANRFVADFIGLSNIFHCRVVRRKQGIVSFGKYEIILDKPDKEIKEEVTISIRPENISIYHFTEEQVPVNNFFIGEINGLTFLGPIARIRVLVSEINFFIDAPNSPHLDYKIGDRVLLTFEKSVCKIIMG